MLGREKKRVVPGGRAGLERNVLENPCKIQTQQIISEVNRVNYGWEMDQHRIDAGGYRGGSGRVGLMMCSTRPLETWVESVSQETSTSGSRCGTHLRPPPQEHESRVPPSCPFWLSAPFPDPSSPSPSMFLEGHRTYTRREPPS